uniref:EF-hand domain-containing protein n=1 Tax=Globodera rostochiensis TaxID=31243 RepID=A0A914GSI8_GLORO
MNGHELAVTSGGLLSSMSSSSRRPSNSRNKSGTGGTTSLHLLGMGTMAASGSSGRGALFVGSFRSKFTTAASELNSEDGSNIPLITKLDKYTADELKEYRQVFNMFDADRSGAIGLDELENAITNLGMDPKQTDVEMLMREADKRGNHQIDFDEFCEVMKATSEKTQSWNEVTKECFSVFDRSESGLIARKDFEFVLRELGDIQNGRLIEELFMEYDVDSDGFIDFDEFSFLVRNYLTDDDVCNLGPSDVHEGGV